MKRKSEIAILLKPLSALQKMMEISGFPWMVIGGVASSLLGRPRFTADVDIVILIEDENLPHILNLAKEFGIYSQNWGKNEFLNQRI